MMPGIMLLQRCGLYRRVSQDNSRYDTCTWPTITIILQYSNSEKNDLLQDNYIMIHHDICLTEEYKMHTLHKHKIFFCPIDAVKAKVGRDFRLESGWCISLNSFHRCPSLSCCKLLLQPINFHSRYPHLFYKHHREAP